MKFTAKLQIPILTLSLLAVITILAYFSAISNAKAGAEKKKESR